MPLYLEPALWSLAAAWLYVTLVWLLSLRLKDSGIMDIFWGPGFVLAVGLAAWLQPGVEARIWLVLVPLGVWAMRLAAHIGRRNLGEPEDARYNKWRRESGAKWWWWSYFKVFLLQGGILWTVSLPLQAAVTWQMPTVLTGLDLVGALIFVTGLGIEAVADRQLASFKSDPERSGVLDTGLWRYSRHPNYFGECVIWLGVAFWSINLPGGWMLLFAPALMIWLVIRVSGVAMLDRHLESSKPGYADYMARTSAFIPMPPRSKTGRD
ncbi:MAG: DUF1295 domain-containing protein [Rhodothermales bacterium]|nr:DUF1295 domain-containing protein [Rhodothermales bacterium]MBO6780598.1 DUF1295 domain-containing protein [Rhodothermales bacterium]